LCYTEVTTCFFPVAEINKELKDWEYIYNRIRPHQPLGYKTPLQFLKDCGILDINTPPFLSHM